MKNEIIEDFVKSIIEEKAYPGLSEEVTNQLVADLSDRLESEINKSLLAKLDDKQLSEFSEKVDNGEVPQLQDYLTSCGVDVPTVVTGAMSRFRASYLGVS